MSTPNEKRDPAYCDQCGTQIGYRKDGRLILFFRHHGKKHEHTVVAERGLTTIPKRA